MNKRVVIACVYRMRHRWRWKIIQSSEGRYWAKFCWDCLCEYTNVLG